MNTPNKLTVARMVLTPIFLILFLIDKIPAHYLLAMIVFIVASFTDLLDGRIARKNNIVTNFGKLADPLADKMLTTAALLGFMTVGCCNVWIIFIVLFREFAISSIRLIAAADGVVIPANIWGKVKTTSQMLSTGAILFGLSLKFDFAVLPAGFPIEVVANILLGITAVLTIVSGVTYIIQGTKVIDFSK